MTDITSEGFRQRFPGVSAGLSNDGVTALLDQFKVEEAAPSEALIAEGTPADALLLVWDGQLDVTVSTPAGDHPAGAVGAGSFLGEVSLLDPGPATATVVAERGCTVLRLSRAGFDDLCARRPDLASQILGELNKTLAARLTASIGRLDAILAEPDPAGPPLTDELVGVHAELHSRGGGR